jgi:hypothetical protein
VTFHASSVILNDKAVLLAGEGGIGKSTLADLLESAGYQVPGDEAAFISRAGDGTWRLTSAIKKICGEYELNDLENPSRVSVVVYLRKHRDFGYAIESCHSARAVKLGIRLLFCDRYGKDDWIMDAFRWTSSIFRQSKAVFLDFNKSLDFLPEIKTLLHGDD